MPNDQTKTTLTGQMRASLTEKHTQPAWVALCVITYAITAGLAAGIWYAGHHVVSDNHEMFWTSVGTAVGALMLPLGVRVVRRLRAKKPMGEAAVSPVIGVILMVAITVVLAAVVFVLVSHLGKVSESPPTVAGEITKGNLTILSVSENDLNWSEFTLTGCTTVPTGTFDAGDEAKGCSGHVRLVYKPANAVVWKGEA